MYHVTYGYGGPHDGAITQHMHSGHGVHIEKTLREETA